MEFGTVKYGHLRKWLHFDGVDDYVNCGNDASLNFTDAITIVAMIKVGGWVNNFPRLISKYESFSLHLIASTHEVDMFIYQNGELKHVTTEQSLSLNNVYLITSIYDSETGFKIYIDESKADLSGATYTRGAIDTNTNDVLIGQYENSVRFFKGDTYSVALYNRALSDAEISQIYDYVVNGKGEMITDGLVLWLDGDSIDIENGIWHDKSGNGNDGIIYGATYNSNWGEVKYGTIHYGV